MSAIYGIVRFDGAPVAADDVSRMREAILLFGPDGGGAWREGSAALGQLVLHNTPESLVESGPVKTDGGAIVTAAARLDNRDELLALLELPSDTTESAIVAAAWDRWGEEAPGHLQGDWAFAAWDPRERRLFVARDQYGMTALYLHHDAHSFSFATGRKALLALPHVSDRLNELQLARQLSWRPGDGVATVHQDIERLPPAHLVVVRRGRVTRRQYWVMEDAPRIRYATDDQYVDHFRELFDRAVRVRLRAPGPIASTLSGGLDSGAITALAARALPDRRLIALTSVPLFRRELAAELPGMLFDEWSLAAATAALYPSMEHVAVDAAGVSPAAAIERLLATTGAPEAGPGSQYWITAITNETRGRAARVLLCGQCGNGGVSWTGRPPRSALRAAAASVLGTLYDRLRYARARSEARKLPAAQGVIHPDFAERIGIAADPPPRAMRDSRLALLLPGVTHIGAIWHEAGARAGIEVRDPTADTRLLQFCLGIPEHLYVRPQGSRWLMRRGVEGLVPPAVQWNTERGHQGGDLAWRLRADAHAVDALVARIAASETARSRIDVPGLERRWAFIRDPGSVRPTSEALPLVHALLAGAFLAREARER